MTEQKNIRKMLSNHGINRAEEIVKGLMSENIYKSPTVESIMLLAVGFLDILKQRNAARRELCELIGHYVTGKGCADGVNVAIERGWDCFKVEEKKD